MNSVILEANQRDRSQFLGDLITGLASALQHSVGLELSEGFIKEVGEKVGEAISRDYASATADEQLSVEQLAEVLIDMKRKIDGGFRVETIERKRIVLVNDRCPFGKQVQGLPSLCQMTSSVFGRIAAANFGYARVDIKESIARANRQCRVVIDLEEPPVRGMLGGDEYYGSRQQSH